MPDIAVTLLPSGQTFHLSAPVTGTEVLAAAAKEGLPVQSTIALKVDSRLCDISAPIDSSCAVTLLGPSTEEGLEVLRHSTAHLLAHALVELYPGTHLAIGPVIDSGFYYDVTCPVTLTAELLPQVEEKMREIAQRHLPVVREPLSRSEALTLFSARRESFKVEIIQALSDGEKLTVYWHGKEFMDLCRGPHAPNTDFPRAFKLLSVAGAYWRGDEKKPRLQRIYGTAFFSEADLEKHLRLREEAQKRDHRRLGEEMELFSFLPEAPAMPFFYPKGAFVLRQLLGWMQKQIRAQGYDEVICPQLMTVDLWKKSGHWSHFQENMFCVFEGDAKETLQPTWAIKPMNCPGHALLFGSRTRSYRDLPIRFYESTRLHRNERTGVSHGLLRTRVFSQDDGHIFCTPEQIEDEVRAFIRHLLTVYSVFGFTDIEVRLATVPSNALVSGETAQEAALSLEKALTAEKCTYSIKPGDGAFYGPKIEFHVRDSLQRQWQCGTIQADFSTAGRFGLTYTDASNQAQTPIILHRAVFGSLERFLGILIEHYAGHLPFWLAPTQVVLLTVTSEQDPYANEVEQLLFRHDFRVLSDTRNEKLGYKIRQAQLQRIPVMLVLGKKEMLDRTVSVRMAQQEAFPAVPPMPLDTLPVFLQEKMNQGGPY